MTSSDSDKEAPPYHNEHTLLRRGFFLGHADASAPINVIDWQAAWHQGQACQLSAFFTEKLPDIAQALTSSELLVKSILEGHSCEQLLQQQHYLKRLLPQFEPMGSFVNEGDDQEIETLLFDARKNDIVNAEDLWMKVSWLSFNENDASLRFRFSFGVDFVEDVAADPIRQSWAVKLASAVFPESKILTEDMRLRRMLRDLLDSDVCYVERIVYFNAPGGGAYLHHDLERGHAGVVYAQVSGSTFWLALPKYELVAHIVLFVQQCAKNQHWPDTISQKMQLRLTALVGDECQLEQAIESFSHEDIIHLINETKEFVQHLTRAGFGFILQPGDIILLPQHDSKNCCWHSVFCLGDEIGQALSFAIKAATADT